MEYGPREFTTRRMGIVTALVEELKKIDGTGDFISDLNGNVSPRMLFWDEVKNFPSVHLAAGAERRQYQGGGFKDRYLSIIIRCYVRKPDEAMFELDKVLEDVEYVVEKCNRLKYYDKEGNEQRTRQITIVDIDTDEGVLDPLGVGEIRIEVEY